MSSANLLFFPTKVTPLCYSVLDGAPTRIAQAGLSQSLEEEQAIRYDRRTQEGWKDYTVPNPKLIVVCSTYGIPFADATSRILTVVSPRLGRVHQCGLPLVRDREHASQTFPLRLWIAESTDSRTPGEPNLRYAIAAHDFAIFVLTPSDITSGGTAWSALCMGLGLLGHKRCFVLAPRSHADALDSELPEVWVHPFDFENSEALELSSDRSIAVTQDSCTFLISEIQRRHLECEAIPLRERPFTFKGVSRGGPCEVFHDVQLHDYCEYARVISGASKQLITVLTIDPKVLVLDIGCAESYIQNWNPEKFDEAVRNRGAHYTAFSDHENAIRIVVRDDESWDARNRDWLVPLERLNGKMKCFVVNRQVLLHLERPIFLVEHTAFDDRVCMYDHTAQTLTVIHIDALMSEPRFGYQELWGAAPAKPDFVPLKVFLLDQRQSSKRSLLEP